jgi:hypothetical protein
VTQRGDKETRRHEMNASATAIWIIVAVVVVGLAVWLGSVALAARKTSQEHRRGGRLRGTAVEGGVHVGGGRSVAPRRDEPVTPGEVPGGDTLHPGAEAPADDTESGDARQVSGSTAAGERD